MTFADVWRVFMSTFLLSMMSFSDHSHQDDVVYAHADTGIPLCKINSCFKYERGTLFGMQRGDHETVDGIPPRETTHFIACKIAQTEASLNVFLRAFADFVQLAASGVEETFASEKETGVRGTEAVGGEICHGYGGPKKAERI